MGNIAVIPARGGSKRIPRKNIKEFCGKPMLAYAIEAARKSGIFEEVMVSTDDEEIAAIAREYGASVPFMRSEVTANDYAPIGDVIAEAVQEYKKLGKTFQYAFCLYATSPFTSPEILQGMYQKLLEDPEADSCTAMFPYNFPPLRARFQNEKGYAQFVFPEYALSRSQDLTPCFNDAGMCFAVNTATFLELKLIDRKDIPYMVPAIYAQDIDTEEDWQMAEFKYQWIHRVK